MKFKLDENLPADLKAMLRAEGHDVTDVVAEELEGEQNRLVLREATEEERISLTFDVDFADIRRYPPGTHAGIVIFRLEDQRWKQLQQPICRLLLESTLEKLDKGLAVVDETRVRFKRPKRR